MINKTVITVQEAIRIATNINPENNTYQEYNDAYVFRNDDIQEEMIGGSSPTVVMKKNGTLSMPAKYFLSGRRIKEIGEPVRFCQVLSLSVTVRSIFMFY